MTALRDLVSRLRRDDPASEPTFARVELERRPDDEPPEALYLRAASREVVEAYRAGEQEAVPRLRLWAGTLERAYGRDDTLDSEIELTLPLSCLDPSPGQDPASLLGPKLRALVMADRGWRARPADMRLLRDLVTAVPSLRDLADDNVFGLAGDVLVHLFLAGVAYRSAEQVASDDLVEPLQVLAVLEAAHSGTTFGTDPDEVIEVSFVEDLPFPGEPGDQIVDLLGPKLRAALVRQRPSLYRLDDDGVLVHLPAAERDAGQPEG